MLGKVLDVAVVRHDPLAVLERVAVEDGEVSVRGTPDVGEDGLRGDDAANSMKERIVEGGRGASGDVRRTVDVKRDTPAVAMIGALCAERVVRVHQGTVDLALNHAAKAE